MRIVVSGTHASGKSTLISDFTLRHPEFAVLPDPFELLDEAGDRPSGALFAAQLRLSADRLMDDALGEDVIVERGPVDFLAYLIALSEVDRRPLDDGLVAQATARSAEAMRAIDVLIVLPLTVSQTVHVGADEYPELRAAMNDVLLDLVDDPDIVGPSTTVAEIAGDPATRLAAVKAVAGVGR